MNKKLSIIIPAYNVETYLDKCINSIANKMYSEVEIVLLDDGSIDSTTDKCDYYERQISNLKVYHLKNGGQAKARNIGIEKSSGEYIMFLDSDDYIDDENFIEKVLDIIEKKPDLIIYGYKKYWENLELFTEKPKLDLKNKNIELLNYLIKTNYYKGCPWDKIIKASIIKENNIKFPEGKLSEDIDWCAQLLLNINQKNIYVLNENPYVYIQHKDSTSKKVKKKHICDILYIFEKYIKRNSEKVLLDYFAYEYCMVLGIINSRVCEEISEEIKKKLYSYKWLLKYKQCKKVKICYIIYKLIGIRGCSKILGKFINMKRRGIE